MIFQMKKKLELLYYKNIRASFFFAFNNITQNKSFVIEELKVNLFIPKPLFFPPLDPGPLLLAVVHNRSHNAPLCRYKQLTVETHVVSFSSICSVLSMVFLHTRRGYIRLALVYTSCLRPTQIRLFNTHSKKRQIFLFNNRWSISSTMMVSYSNVCIVITNVNKNVLSCT